MSAVMQRDPSRYAGLIIQPGDFHFMVHVLIAIWRLFWDPLLKYLVDATENSNVLKKGEFAVSHAAHVRASCVRASCQVCGARSVYGLFEFWQI